MKLILALLLSAYVPASLAAQTPDQPKKAKHASKRICVRQNITGSRMPTSICHTQAEWDANAQANALPIDQSRLPSSQH